MSTEFQNEFKLKFDGELNEVDASTLGYSLLNVTALIQEVNQEVGAGQKIEIKVKAHQPGSFLVHLALDAGQAVPLMDYLTPENLKIASAALGGIITVVTGLFGLRKVLKGEPPKEVVQQGDSVQIQAGDGAIVIVDKGTYNAYFNNPKVNEALSKTFKTLDNDPHITGFEITDRNEVPMFEAKREEFRPMALTSSVPQAQAKAIRQFASLYIVKPSFERNLKWDVVYQGNRIAVEMGDETFLLRIDRGERFAKGDTLDVELQIDQVLDPNINTYINKGYQVVQVINHMPRVEQFSLNFGAQSPYDSLKRDLIRNLDIKIEDDPFRKELGPSTEQPKHPDKL
ncbi:MAG TPA: hypothetical protein VIQ24_17130, partial [Pyrinomonadaceae bacterium]